MGFSSGSFLICSGVLLVVDTYITSEFLQSVLLLLNTLQRNFFFLTFMKSELTTEFLRL